VSDIVPEGAVQPQTLFGDVSHKEQPLMRAVDDLRARFGSDVVRTGAEGIQKKWHARHNLLSPGYTTSWSEVLLVGE
jgi:DNA polymerase V